MVRMRRLRLLETPLARALQWRTTAFAWSGRWAAENSKGWSWLSGTTPLHRCQRKSLKQSRLLRFRVEPTFAPVPVWGWVLVRWLYRRIRVLNGRPRGVEPSATTTSSTNVYWSFSALALAIRGNDQPAFRGQKRQEDSNWCYNHLVYLPPPVLVGIRALQLPIPRSDTLGVILNRKSQPRLGPVAFPSIST